MSISRRLFMFGALCASAVLAIPTSLKALKGLPILYGDGEHNDLPAVNAMFRGERVYSEVAGRTVQMENGVVHFPPGEYYLGGLIVPPRSSVVGSGTINGHGSIIRATPLKPSGEKRSYRYALRNPEAAA